MEIKSVKEEPLQQAEEKHALVWVTCMVGLCLYKTESLKTKELAN